MFSKEIVSARRDCRESDCYDTPLFCLQRQLGVVAAATVDEFYDRAEACKQATGGDLDEIEFQYFEFLMEFYEASSVFAKQSTVAHAEKMVEISDKGHSWSVMMVNVNEGEELQAEWVATLISFGVGIRYVANKLMTVMIAAREHATFVKAADYADQVAAELLGAEDASLGGAVQPVQPQKKQKRKKQWVKQRSPGRLLRLQAEANGQ